MSAGGGVACDQPGTAHALTNLSSETIKGPDNRKVPLPNLFVN